MVLASLTRRDGGTPGPGTEVRRAGGLGDWNNLRKQLLRMLFFFTLSLELAPRRLRRDPLSGY